MSVFLVVFILTTGIIFFALKSSSSKKEEEPVKVSDKPEFIVTKPRQKVKPPKVMKHAKQYDRKKSKKEVKKELDSNE